jgi:hypothetical protein
MGIRANLQNLLYFTGRLAPMMMIFVFVFVSIINKDWKGIMYLSGVIVSCFFAIIMSNTLQNFFKSTVNLEFNMCYMTDKPVSLLPLSGVILGFTVMYLLLPMLRVYKSITNPLLFLTLLLFVAVDIIFIMKNECAVFNFVALGSFVNRALPVVISYIIGSLIAHIYVLVLTSTNNGSLLYFSAGDSGPMCNVSKKDKKFKCKVYRNGELLNT